MIKIEWTHQDISSHAIIPDLSRLNGWYKLRVEVKGKIYESVGTYSYKGAKSYVKHCNSLGFRETSL